MSIPMGKAHDVKNNVRRRIQKNNQTGIKVLSLFLSLKYIY